MAFGAASGSFLAYEGAFGAILEALWGHFGRTLGSLWVYSNDSVSLYDHFGIIVESLWVYEGRFSKNINFRIGFNESIKHWGRLGSVWGRFGATFGI